MIFASVLRSRLLAASLVFAGLSGCAATYQNHGYVPLQDDVDQIVVGVDTRDTVAESVGTPAASGVLRDNGYFYIKSRVRTMGFLEPQEIEREVLAISFDDDGVVSNIERFGLEDGQVVRLSRRVTETGVRDTNFLRQLLDSIGQFDPSAAFEN